MFQENDILTKRSDRSLQDRIGLLKQEVSIISQTIESQSHIFELIASCLQDWRRGTGKTPQTVYPPSGFGQPGYTPSGFGPPAYSGMGQPAYSGYGAPGYASGHASGYGNKGNNPFTPPPYNPFAPDPYNVIGSGPVFPYNTAASYAGPVGGKPTVKSRAPFTRRPGGTGNFDDFDVDLPFDNGLNEFSADFKLRSTDPGGFRDLLLQECLAQLAQRANEFSQFQAHAYQLDELVRHIVTVSMLSILIKGLQNRNKVDTTKDRQERAIYAFTIVTIIFLPLSAVASIFGMNTADVRSMDVNQWAYWATAIPVTTLVILLGLWWTGELENIFRWAASFVVRKVSYRPIPEQTLYQSQMLTSAPPPYLYYSYAQPTPGPVHPPRVP